MARRSDLSIYFTPQLSFGHAMTRIEASTRKPFAQRSLDAGVLRHDSSQSISYLLGGSCQVLVKTGKESGIEQRVMR